MPAEDIIHQAVRNALEKDGWIITEDPLYLRYKDVQVFIDLGAERVLAAERSGEKIAVEIKSFVGRSAIHDLQDALGQFNMYHSILQRREPERRLYVAISQEVFERTFQRPGIKDIVEDNRLSLIIVDVIEEEVRQWIPR